MSDSASDEAAWWLRARDGDGEAMGHIFDRHQQRVYHHALRVLHNPTAAEDATAVAFLELWRRRASVRVVDGSVLPWLLVTTANACRNIARSTRRYRTLIDALPRQDHSLSVEQEAELQERNSEAHLEPELARALGKLTSTTRGLMVLTLFEGYSISEAARATGMSEGAARTRLSRARAQLREELRDWNSTRSDQQARPTPAATVRQEAHHD